MITSMDIYWIMQMDSIIGTFRALTIFSAIAVLLFAVCYLMFMEDDGDIGKKSKKYAIVFTVPFILFLVTANLIPSTKTLAAMYTVPAVVNSEKAAKLGTDSIEVLELGLARLKEVLQKESE